MRSFITRAKSFAASAQKVRHINIALFGLVLLLAGMAIGHSSVPQFVQEVWAATIGGAGTVSKVAAFTATDTLGDSTITQDGPTSVTVGSDLTVTGDVALRKSATVTGTLFAKSINATGGNVNVNGSIDVFDFNTHGNNHFDKGIVTEATLFAKDVTVSNSLSVTGSVNSVVKNFVIDHPLKPGYELVHSSLEGPEIGVFYRGSGRLIAGRATVTLPDYFDALTRDHTATVLLTAKGEMPFLLSYDRFDEKSFVVHGAKADGEFNWEVKAVRADVPALEVERKK